MLNDEDEEFFLNTTDVEASNMASDMQATNKKDVTVSVADPVVPTSAVLMAHASTSVAACNTAPIVTTAVTTPTISAGHIPVSFSDTSSTNSDTSSTKSKTSCKDQLKLCSPIITI